MGNQGIMGGIQGQFGGPVNTPVQQELFLQFGGSGMSHLLATDLSSPGLY